MLPFCQGDMRSLEKRALDSLIQQLLTKIGDHARVVGPSGSLTALDDRYVGVLKHLLLEAYGAPLRCATMDAMKKDYNALGDDRERFFQYWEITGDPQDKGNPTPPP